MSANQSSPEIIEERHRIAKLLHDAFSQSLFAASTIASSLPVLIETKPDKARTYINELDVNLREASQDLRTILNELTEEEV